MKSFFVLLLLFLGTKANSQEVIGSVNSGAHSGSDFVYTVGEIYVESTTSADENNSGLMGILYQVAFNVTGIETVLSTDDIRAYPNPSNQTVFFEFRSDHKIDFIFILDNNGQVVQSCEGTVRQVDLSHLPAGTYFIKTSSTGIRALKIIKH
jgi:hypothetical protein